MANTKNLPLGIKLLKIITRKCQWNLRSKYVWHRGLVLFLTYITYMSYHFTRKPISVVKNVLHPNCSSSSHVLEDNLIFHNSNCSGWAPFGELPYLSYYQIECYCLYYY